jgi:5'-hydroxyaverantin dehydrogenase
MEPIHPEVNLALLKDKSVLVTGGASGIGLATARAWAAAGAYVTIADIQPVEAGQQLAAELSSAGGHVNYSRCDVTSWDSQVAAFKSAVTFSPSQTLDIVATFAGTAFALGNEVDHVLAAGEPSLAVDPKEPNIRNIEVNLIGVYYSSWLALYYFRLKPRAVADGADATSTDSTDSTDYPAPTKASTSIDKSLILVASIAAYMDSPKASTYPASKFGVRGLFRSTRARTLDIGVRCNLLAPWFIDTPLIAPMKSAMASRGINMAKALSFASIESCVEAAHFCAANPQLHGK